MTEHEVFVVCAEYPNYSISNHGRVKNNKTGNFIKARPRDERQLGYCVDLRDEDGNHLVYVHRLVAKAFIPNPNNLPFIDHIDHNPKNNMVSNLRWATPQQNTFNSAKRKSECTSKYKGVCKRNDNGRYRARIRLDNKLINIGTYATEEEAAKAYDDKAKELFGDFAVLNFS